MQSYFEYFKQTEQNYYGTKKVRMPEPELYVICTAERKRKPKVITLSKEFFGGKDIAIDAKVRMKLLRCMGEANDAKEKWKARLKCVKVLA